MLKTDDNIPMNTMSAREAKKVIKPQDWSVNIDSREQKVDMQETKGGLLDMYSSYLHSEGRDPKFTDEGRIMLDKQGKPIIEDVDTMINRRQYDFRNAAGKLLKGSGYEDNFSTASGFAQAQFGPWTVTKENNQWTDQDGNPWDEETVQRAIEKRRQIDADVYNESRVGNMQGVWEAFNPLAVGDTALGIAANNQMTSTQDRDPSTGEYLPSFQMSPIYAQSTPESLERRADINHPGNVLEPRNKQGFFKGLFDFWGK